MQDEALLLRGGSQSLLARQLRAPKLWSGRLSTDEYRSILGAMLAAAASYGLVTVAFGNGSEGWQLQGNVVRFRRRPPPQAAEGRVGPNPYFVNLYDNLSRLLVEGPDGLPRLEGREHTAQVEGTLREIREVRFRFEEDDVRKLGERGTYRYLATEGFLPGYNFPRLPLLAYVPAAQDSVRKQTFLQRARFLGISEFGPRSLVYHEGRAFRVVKAMISASVRADGDGRLATRAIEV